MKMSHRLRPPFLLTKTTCRLCCCGCRSSMDISSYKEFSCIFALQLQCIPFNNYRHFSTAPSLRSSKGCVHQYNSLNSQPDVLKSLYSALQPSSDLEDLRYHDGGRLSDQQRALLQYQLENIHYLSEEILRLQECSSKYERSDDGSTPQVDLAHLLAAGDQELRALSAEMNQVQSELRLARNLIAEWDTKFQKIRTTNNQYIEENERLRAILREWSTRAAKKLERMLEVERLSNLELQKKISKLRKQKTESIETSDMSLNSEVWVACNGVPLYSSFFLPHVHNTYVDRIFESTT